MSLLAQLGAASSASARSLCALVAGLALLACDDAEIARDARHDSGATDAASPLPDAGDTTSTPAGLRVYMKGNDVMLGAIKRAGLAILTCSNALRLQKREGDSWVAPRDERPPLNDHPGYYLDGAFVSPTHNLGCDVRACHLLDEETRVAAAVEYVKTGTRTEAPADAPIVYDEIESRALDGELRVVLDYSVGISCDAVETIALELSVPDGVCCPLDADGCSGEGPAGGWAPSRAGCADSRVREGDCFSRTTDLRGCPVWVEDRSAWCSCAPDADAGR